MVRRMENMVACGLQGWIMGMAERTLGRDFERNGRDENEIKRRRIKQRQGAEGVATKKTRNFGIITVITG